MTDDVAGVSRTALLAAEALGAPPASDRLARLRDAPLLLAIDPTRAASRRGQLMLATAASLLGRLFDFAPAIDVAAPGVRTVDRLAGVSHARPLDAAIVELLAALPPDDRGFRYRAGAREDSYQIALVVGDRPSGMRADTVVHIDGEAWGAAVGPDPMLLPSGDASAGAFNPFGPLVAAALGAAEVAKHVFRRLGAPEARARLPLLPAPVVWDLWRHAFDRGASGPPLPAALDLGRFALAGLGALGGAITWALAHIGEARGTVELVDDDRLEASNLERVLTATGADVGTPKVRAAARLLAGTALRPVPLVGRYLFEPPRGARATTILAGVDSGAARRQLQALLPRALYNGGTQGSELLVSRHLGLEGPCLECLYPDIDDPVGRTATRLGVDRDTAAALSNGERTIDAAILAAMRERGIRVDEGDAVALLGAPLVALETRVCSRAIVIPDLPAATISFVSALAGFLMTAELVKDRMSRGRRDGPLDSARPVFRLDALAGVPGPDCVERYVARSDCPCRAPETRARFARARSA
jgi:molybdopterin/thiamine biosynthesis adenylyltransferase